MAHPDTLIPGNCYFNIGYADQNLFIPLINTYIYIEKKQDENGDYWLFQDAHSYFWKDDVESKYLSVQEDMLSRIVELTELLNNLKELEDLHPIVKDERNITANPIELTASNIDQLRDQVQMMLENDEYRSLTTTIKYRDDGFSISKNKDTLKFNFFINWIKHPEREELIRTLFTELSITPHTDYLAQHGRARILDYPFPADTSEILRISIRLFTDIYKIKSNETLNYYLHKKDEIKNRI